jgi:3-phosphoshikimate 1-carboxyvinyltransferase
LIVTTKDKIVFEGILTIPASKSQAQRAIALALLNEGTTQLNGLGFCDDEKAALSITEHAGAIVNITSNQVTIHSNGFNPKEEISVNVRESGLSSRMFTPILANSKKEVLINGHGTVLSRPMDFFFDVFPELGVDISSSNHRIPLKVKGPLQAKHIEIDGSKSSQFVTGILYGFLGSEKAGGKCIRIKDLKSRPYVELSVEVLKHFGVKVSFLEDTLTFPSYVRLTGDHIIDIEGDWSSASFFIVGAAINGSLTLNNLKSDSKQADIAILDAVTEFGADVSHYENRVQIKSSNNKAFNFNATDCPDLFPPLAVLALFGNGNSEIKGLHRLKHKESDRGEGIKSTFKKLGIEVELDYKSDVMRIRGGQKIKGGMVDSLNDHRMAMALTIIGVLSGEQIVVTNAEAINKSFPSFYELLLTLSNVLNIK